MEERNALSFGSDSRDFINERHAGGTTLRESCVEVVDGKAKMVNAGTAFCDEARDRRIGMFGFEQLDESIAGRKAGDLRAVAVGEGNLSEPEDITKERNRIAERLYGEAEMCDAGAARGVGRIGHWRRNGM